VFALGCVLGYAATGRAPFDGDSIPAIMHRLLLGVPDLGRLPPGPFRDAVEACLAKDPARRPGLPDLMVRFAVEPPTVLVPGGPAGPAPAGRGAGEPSDRDAGDLPAVLPDAAPAAAEAPGAQVSAEHHENVTITQQANAGPGSVVIQVAGNAKLGDDA
jgi:hypothetical protein